MRRPNSACHSPFRAIWGLTVTQTKASPQRMMADGDRLLSDTVRQQRSPPFWCRSGVDASHRFEFTFTPKHGSWLNLVEGFFSKLARSVLRHIRVASKQELKDRIMPPWISSTRTPSFTPGLTNSIRPPDMIRTSETLI
jgi:hypothetical protein